MRKLVRTHLRYLAEKNDGKTIKVFRKSWRRHIEKRKPVSVTGTKMAPKKEKKQSLLRRVVNKVLRKNRKSVR